MSTFESKNKFLVDNKSTEMRLDNYLLKKFKGVPKSKIYKIIRTGEVRVNSKRIKPLYKIKEGDLVRVPPNLILDKDSKKKPIKPKNLDWMKDIIISEEDGFLVLNKPSRIAVHGGSGSRRGLIELLRLQRNNPKEDLELVHRLDKDTSGCLLISKKRSKLRMLHKYFREGQVDKIYVGLLMGSFQKNEFTVNEPLEINSNNNLRKAIPSKDGKKAVTKFKLLEKFDGCGLFEIKPITGKTHQIRAHASFIRKPLAGDQRYNSEPDLLAKRFGLNRLFLHASSISFPSLEDDKNIITYESDLGKELNDVISKLRN